MLLEETNLQNSKQVNATVMSKSGKRAIRQSAATNTLLPASEQMKRMDDFPFVGI